MLENPHLLQKLPQAVVVSPSMDQVLPLTMGKVRYYGIVLHLKREIAQGFVKALGQFLNHFQRSLCV